MAAPEVEAAVLVGDEARGGEQDALHGPALHGRRGALDGRLVDVDVGAGVILHQPQVLLHHHHGAFGLEAHGHLEGQLAVDVHIEVAGHQTRGLGVQVVGVEGHILEDEGPPGIAAHPLPVARHGIGEGQAGPGHGPALVIGHPARQLAAGGRSGESRSSGEKGEEGGAEAAVRHEGHLLDEIIF